MNELLVEHDLSPHSVWSFAGNRIPWNAFADVLEDAGERLGGQQALEEVGADSLLWGWETILAIVLRYVTPFRAFELGVRWFGPAIFHGINAQLEELSDGLIEIVEIPQDRRDSIEFFSLCRGVMREFPTILGWKTEELHFRHSDRRGEYRLRYVRSPMRVGVRLEPRPNRRFEQDLEELSILKTDFEPLPSFDPSPRSMGGRTAASLRAILHRSARGMSLTASDSARRLALSERSLARRLASEGTSFRAVRDEVRREIAIDRIQRGEPIAAVGDALGFADVPSFHRAFRRWTGQAPGRFKRDPDWHPLG